MKQTNKFSSAFRLCVVAVVLQVAAATAVQAQDMWLLPGPNTWMGKGLIGSPTDPSLVPVQFQGEILLVPPTEIAGYLQRGGRTGWPEVIVPMIVDGQPVAARIWQVESLLRKGGQVADDLVIMHKGDEQVAVRKSQVDEYKAKGYQPGPKEGWTEGVVMCFKNRVVVVDVKAVDKYKNQGAEAGPCK
ncbi:MAG: hypothetical protein FJ395_09715 [Verrucomicrobia bacterium]|nr:hypothetical protein [Verrucomicrobiota bacterium]